MMLDRGYLSFFNTEVATRTMNKYNNSNLFNVYANDTNRITAIELKFDN